MASNAKYSRAFENFMTHENIQFFNSGKIQFRKLEDLILFSSLTHNQILKINHIKIKIWHIINKTIKDNADQMSINLALIIPSLLIHCYEAFGNDIYLTLPDAIKETNKYLMFLFNNFEMLDYTDEVNLTNFSDNIFYYYSLFMHETDNPLDDKQTGKYESFLKNLMKIYSIKIKTKPNFNLFQEIRILNLMAKDLKFRDPEFWHSTAKKVADFLQKDFVKILNEIFPKRLKNSAMNSQEENMKFQEISNMSILFYSGVILETFVYAEYLNDDFWDILIDKLDKYANFKAKESYLSLQFISFRCRRLYSDTTNSKYNAIWKKFVNILEPNMREICKHKELLDFLIKFHFDKFSSKTEHFINLDELNTCLNNIVYSQIEINENENISHLTVFITFFKLIEVKLYDDKVK